MKSNQLLLTVIAVALVAIAVTLAMPHLRGCKEQRTMQTTRSAEVNQVISQFTSQGWQWERQSQPDREGNIYIWFKKCE